MKTLQLTLIRRVNFLNNILITLLLVRTWLIGVAVSGVPHRKQWRRGLALLRGEWKGLTFSSAENGAREWFGLWPAGCCRRGTLGIPNPLASCLFGSLATLDGRCWMYFLPNSHHLIRSLLLSPFPTGTVTLRCCESLMQCNLNSSSCLPFFTFIWVAFSLPPPLVRLLRLSWPWFNWCK